MQVEKKYTGEPAKSIVDRLGGPKIVAKALDLTTGAVSRWYAPKDQGGCGGLVPSHRITQLIKLARKGAFGKRMFLEPNMFFDGHV